MICLKSRVLTYLGPGPITVAARGGGESLAGNWVPPPTQRNTRLHFERNPGGPWVCGLWVCGSYGPRIMDRRRSECSCVDIGLWASGVGAMSKYMDKCELERDVALEVALMSEDEEWID